MKKAEKPRIVSAVLGFILGSAVLQGCFDVVFEQPQPGSFKNLSGFPEPVYGKYIFIPRMDSTQNSTTHEMTIENNQVVYTVNESEKVLLSEKDKIARLESYKNSRKENPTRVKTFSHTIKGDTFYFFKSEKTYYTIGREFLLRRMDNNYFLNIPDTIYEMNKKVVGYDVLLLSFRTSDTLVLSIPSFEVTPKNKDTVYSENEDPKSQKIKACCTIAPFHQWKQPEGGDLYTADPDSTQLRELIKKGLFIEFGVYHKLK